MTLDQLDALFEEAQEIAVKYSDDAETKVGALLVWTYGDGMVMERAANTFIHGASNLPNTRPDKYKYIVHAEANLMFTCAHRGLPTEEAIVICTLSPCQNCIRAMFQSGVREVYYRDLYSAHDPSMMDIKVTEEKVGPYTRMVLSNYEC